MLAKLICESSFFATPIGQIPKGFPNVEGLCKAASIEYHDLKLGDIAYRGWSIVADKEPAMDSRGRQKGSASRNFKKFCMLLDFIEHQHPDWTRESVLYAAINQSDPKHKSLMAMSWQKMNDELAKMSLKSYEIVRTNKKQPESDLPDF